MQKSNKIKQLIIENCVKIISVFYKKYDLNTSELNYIHNNQFTKEIVSFIDFIFASF